MIQHAEALAQRLEGVIARRQIWLLALWTVALFGVGISASRARPFWFDEIFTWEIARPGAAAGVMEQLRQQIDQHPPVFFWITRLGFAFTGNEHVAARLPAMFGVWLMGVCLFRFVQRRGGALLGAFAIGVVLNTIVVRYLVEARPYGLVLGFSALALLSWQAAAMPHRGFWPLAGITLGIAGAISSSYYGAMVAAPLICAELVRAALRRRGNLPAVDFPVWIAVVLGGSAAAPWMPLVLGSVRGFAGRNFATPHLSSYSYASQEMLIPVIPLMIGAVILIGFYTATAPAPAPGDIRRQPRFSPPEMTAVVGFALIPLLALIVALLWINRFASRYVLEGVLGVAILIAVAVWTAVRGSALVGLFLILIAAGTAAGNGFRILYRDAPYGPSLAAVSAEMVSGEPADLPIAMDEPLTCLEMMHYGRREFARRLVFIVDQPLQSEYAAVPYEGETWLTMARVWGDVRAERLRAFVREHPRFLLLNSSSPFTYLLPVLLAHGADMRLIAAHGGLSLYAVSVAPGAF